MAIGQQLIASVLPLVSLLAVTITPAPIQFSENPKEVQNPPTREIVWITGSGESLMGIAEKHYGDEDFVSLILKDNDWINDPNDVEEGIILKLRDKNLGEEEKKEAKKLATSVPVKKAGKPVTTKKETPKTNIQPAAGEHRPSGYDDVYREAGARYGVPWEILYGLHLTETGLRDGEIYNKTGSGAQGPMQFMPGTWRAYGVDGNGDGVADINNAVDAIHGAANYLAKHGSLSQGLRSYGGNTYGTLAAARSRGFTEM